MSVSKCHRLRWPRFVRWVLKMDAYGGLPEWWQWFIPRYGNYGGVGWSAGRWLKPGDDTDWSVAPRNALDALFRQHDMAYRPGKSRIEGDAALVVGLCAVAADDIYGRAYRRGAAVAFAAHLGWLSFSRRGLC